MQVATILPGWAWGVGWVISVSVPLNKSTSSILYTNKSKFHFEFPLIIDGEGNGNPLQYSCLKNPMDGGAWQATVHGVTLQKSSYSPYHFTPYYKILVFDPQEAKIEKREILSQYSGYHLGFALVSSVNRHTWPQEVTGKRSPNLVSTTSESRIHGFHVYSSYDAGNSLIQETDFQNSFWIQGNIGSVSFCKVTTLVEHLQIRQDMWMLDFIWLESWLLGPVYSRLEAEPPKGNSGVLLKLLVIYSDFLS